jgi:hypothetical protein
MVGLTGGTAGAAANAHASCVGYNTSQEVQAGPQAISNEILPYVGPGFGTDVVGIFSHTHGPDCPA